MSLFNSLFGWTKPREVKIPEQPIYTVTTTVIEKPVKPRKPKAKKTKPAPELAVETPPLVTAEVKVIKLDFDPKNPRLGSLELDWNDQFIDLLAEHGYRGNNAEELVDAWLNDICKTILANGYPGASVTNIDGSRYVKQRDIGDGKTEVS